jgi:hypothetical protein
VEIDDPWRVFDQTQEPVRFESFDLRRAQKPQRSAVVGQ